MKIKTIFFEILLSTLAIAIIPLIIATFFNIKETGSITGDLIYKHQDTLIANLQENEVSRVKSLANETMVLINSYERMLSDTGTLISILPDEAIYETIDLINQNTEQTYDLIDISEAPGLYDKLTDYYIYIEHPCNTSLNMTNENYPMLNFCFYKLVYSSSGKEYILSLSYNLQQPLSLIFTANMRTSSAFIVDQDGLSIYHSLHEDKDRRKYLGDLEVVQASLKGIGSGSIYFIDPDDEQMFGAFANISLFNLNWGIISQSPLRYALFYLKDLEEESNLQINRILLISLYILAITIVAVSIVSYFLARRISDPIKSFETKAALIANGKYSQTIDIRSQNEIGRLAHTFNFMTRKIRDYIYQLENAAKENEELFLESIQALASSIDAKDPYTKGHSERVTTYSTTIAYALGLPSHIIKRVKIAALLHDIGKIGIMDSILQKPGTLNDDEFKEMQKHPILGANIMGSISKLRDIIPGMKHHHERHDGTGYPDKIKGDFIPLEAKIISIADTFDAMTTDRPYQKRMDPDEVVLKIIGWSGTRYDPKIVKAFKKAYQENLRRLFYEN